MSRECEAAGQRTHSQETPFKTVGDSAEKCCGRGHCYHHYDQLDDCFKNRSREVEESKDGGELGAEWNTVDARCWDRDPGRNLLCLASEKNATKHKNQLTMMKRRWKIRVMNVNSLHAGTRVNLKTAVTTTRRTWGRVVRKPSAVARCRYVWKINRLK